MGSPPPQRIQTYTMATLYFYFYHKDPLQDGKANHKIGKRDVRYCITNLHQLSDDQIIAEFRNAMKLYNWEGGEMIAKTTFEGKGILYSTATGKVDHVDVERKIVDEDDYEDDEDDYRDSYKYDWD
jgi:hypothetical protein